MPADFVSNALCEAAMRDRASFTPSCAQWRFGGFLGERIDTVLRARILDPQAREAILGEAVEAFRKRVDDRLAPNAGFWQGEFWGKYSLAAIAAQRYTGDADLRDSLIRAADDLLATQDPSGYIGTYFDSSFVLSREGKINWNVWCRKYTLWGLLEIYDMAGEARHLHAARRLMDHLMSEVGPGKVEIVRTGVLAGLPSTSLLTPVVMLYRRTADERYLKYAEYIVEQWSRGVGGPPDILRKGLAGAPVHEWFPEPEKWAKSYEFISCVEGLVDMYRVTGREDYRRCAVAIYDNLRRWERSPAGGISFNDKFVGSNRLINVLSEICDAVYWSRLSFQLLLLTGEPRYADEIERTLCNALLAAASPDGRWGLRRLRFSHEHVPAPQHCRLEHHQCCVDNLPRGLMLAADAALLADARGVYVALYGAGSGEAALPSGRRMRVSIEGRYPDDGAVAVRLRLSQPETFALRLRVPEWSRRTQASGPDGARLEARPGEWLSVEREWRDGDCVALEFDMRPRLVRFDDRALDAGDPLVQLSIGQWAGMRNMLPGAPPHTLEPEEARPHAPALLVERGPILLARDERLGGGGSIYESLPAAAAAEPPRLEPIEAPPGIHAAYKAGFAGMDRAIRLCDFASAGNGWDRRKGEFNVWMTVRENGT
ncbi:MAG: hypothetical protein BWZ10_01367 [candidate division BRC1 bacterium ADurb.BinA364]|nr:MAG: hypothetical protein BWZ10_01367 [candidate division BRC1 bacterium ADurb.BinA364]